MSMKSAQIPWVIVNPKFQLKKQLVHKSVLDEIFHPKLVNQHVTIGYIIFEVVPKHQAHA